MLRAIIFDFDGVLVDSEPLIFKLTQEMAAQEGWMISEEEYYRDYLALDDRRIVEHLYSTHGLALDRARRDELVHWKARAYWDLIRDGLPPLQGAIPFVRELEAQYPLAIASGSLRAEIEHLLEKMGLRDAFRVLVTADDVERSKPDPEVFLKALTELRQLFAGRGDGGKERLRAAECLVIEDAPAGVRAAHAAGMKSLALAHSRPLEELREADWVCRAFDEVDLGPVVRAFAQP